MTIALYKPTHFKLKNQVADQKWWTSTCISEPDFTLGDLENNQFLKS